MSSKYMKKSTSIESFSEILSVFTKEILRNQPKDIIDFAITYFKNLEEEAKLESLDKGDNISCNYKPRIPRMPTSDRRTQETSINETIKNSRIQSGKSSKSDNLMKGGGEIIEPSDEISIMEGGGIMIDSYSEEGELMEGGGMMKCSQESFNKTKSSMSIMKGGGVMDVSDSKRSSMSIMKGGGVMDVSDSKRSSMSIMKGGGVMDVSDSKRSSMSIMKGGGVMDVSDSKRSSMSNMKGGGIMEDEI